MKISALLVLLFTLVLSGCEQTDKLNQALESAERVKNLEKEVASLKVQLKEQITETGIEKITRETVIELLLKKINSLEQRFPSKVYLNPAEKGYAIIGTLGGFFSVSCDKIEGYSSGSKVYLEVVNFSSVTTTDVNVMVAYSPDPAPAFNEKIPDAYQTAYANYQKSLVQRVEKIDSIEPGRRQIIELRMPEYKPDNLRNLEISVFFSGIRYGQTK